jgi:hypothetical protein
VELFGAENLSTSLASSATESYRVRVLGTAWRFDAHPKRLASKRSSVVMLDLALRQAYTRKIEIKVDR